MNKLVVYFFLHFAISAWPFLNFYGSEANHRLVSLSSFSLLFIVFWGISILTCELARKILHATYTRILIAYTFFIISFFSYPHVLFLVHKFNFSEIKFTFLFIVIAAIFIGYILSMYSSVQKAIQIFIVVVFSFSSLENIFISFKKEKAPFPQVRNEKITAYTFKEKPNIYFLLLDAYGRSDVIKSNLDYDNAEFVNFFKDKGFIVANQSYSNYSATATSLSATLNMNYIIPADFNENEVFSPDKVVLSILRKNNYKFISLPAYYDFVIPKNTADVIITPSANILFSLTNINFLQTTIFELLTRLIRPFLYFGENEIKKIFQLNKNESKFVFLHFLQLHDFAYDKNCKITPHIRQDGATHEDFHTNLSCINSFVMSSINQIMANDPQGIIIVQGDHGPSWWRTSSEFPTTSQEFENIFSIFSAVYIPDFDKGSIPAKYFSASPSPVNNFRIIFSYLSETPIELLPEHHYSYLFHELTHVRPENLTP